MEKVNMTSNCDFSHEIMTLSHIIETTNKDICPSLGTRSEFCEILMGNMTPLLFPYLFVNLDHLVYIDRSLVFQDNIGLIYPVLEKVKRSKAGIAMAPEQSKAYMQAFNAWQRMNPSTKIGKEDFLYIKFNFFKNFTKKLNFFFRKFPKITILLN